MIPLAQCISPAAKKKPPAIKAFENNLTDGLHSLRAEESSPSLSLGWIQQALELLLSTRENLDRLLPTEIPQRIFYVSWFNRAKNEVDKLIEVCTVLRKNIEDIKYYQMFVHLALLSLDREGLPSLTQGKRTRLLLKNCTEALQGKDEEISRLRLQKARMETCKKLLGEVEQIITEEDLMSMADEYPNEVSFLAAFYGLKITTMFILQILSNALAINPKQNIEEIAINRQPSWAHQFLRLNKKLKEQTEERKLKGSFSFLPELAATDAAVSNMYKLLDEMINKGDLKQDAAKLKKLSAELKQKSDELEKGLSGVDLQLGELIQVLVCARSSLIDISKECKKAGSC